MNGHRTQDRPWDAGWVEREVRSLDVLVSVPTDVLEERMKAWGLCLPGPVIGEPPDPPPEVEFPDRWLAARLCDGCRARRECLEVELRDAGQETTGVWGGLDDDDRRALLAQWQAHPARRRWDGTSTPDSPTDRDEEKGARR